MHVTFRCRRRFRSRFTCEIGRDGPYGIRASINDKVVKFLNIIL